MVSQVALAQISLRFSPVLPAAEAPPTGIVTGKQGGARRLFRRRARYRIAGVIVAFLGEQQRRARGRPKRNGKRGLKEAHLRVRFAQPQSVGDRCGRWRKPIGVGDPRVNTANRLPNRLLARCGDKYHSFGKYDGHLSVLLKDRYLPRK